MAHIHLEIYPFMAKLSIDNPSKANCLTQAMLDELLTHLHTIEKTEGMRMIVLTGTGERFFCSGADVKEWSKLSADAMSRQWVRGGHQVFRALRGCDIPTVCVLNGDAFGGGLELALMCDYRIALKGVDLALPEGGVGTIPGWLACEQLAQLTSISTAKQMILLGKKLSAKQAHHQGIIDQLCEAEMLVPTLDDLLRTLQGRSPYISSVAKRLIHASYGIDSTAVLHEFAAYMTIASEAGKEGKKAFIEKRPPNFEH